MADLNYQLEQDSGRTDSKILIIKFIKYKYDYIFKL